MAAYIERMCSLRGVGMNSVISQFEALGYIQYNRPVQNEVPYGTDDMLNYLRGVLHRARMEHAERMHGEGPPVMRQ